MRIQTQGGQSSSGLIMTKLSELHGPLSCRLPDGRTVSAVLKHEYPEHGSFVTFHPVSACESHWRRDLSFQ